MANRVRRAFRISCLWVWGQVWQCLRKTKYLSQDLNNHQVITSCWPFCRFRGNEFALYRVPRLAAVCFQQNGKRQNGKNIFAGETAKRQKRKTANGKIFSLKINLIFLFKTTIQCIFPHITKTIVLFRQRNNLEQMNKDVNCNCNHI